MKKLIFTIFFLSFLTIGIQAQSELPTRTERDAAIQRQQGLKLLKLEYQKYYSKFAESIHSKDEASSYELKEFMIKNMNDYAELMAKKTFANDSAESIKEADIAKALSTEAMETKKMSKLMELFSEYLDYLQK